MRADVTGAGPFKLYSYAVSLRAGRSYILTGLMKSQGNSGAQFRLEDSVGNILLGGVVGGLPAGNIESPKLVADQQWYNAARNDTVRYRTPVYVAAADMTAYVVVLAGGTAGAKCWFDAMKLEESTVATPWSPAAIGAVVIDAGGVQVDGTRGGILRYKGSTGGARDTVEGYQKGLLLGGDTELISPSVGNLAANGALLAKLTDIPTNDPLLPGGIFTGPTKTGIATGNTACPLTTGGRINASGQYQVAAGEAGIYFYRVIGVLVAVGGGSNFRVFAYKNGVSLAGGGGWVSTSTAGASMYHSGVIDMAVGDTLEVRFGGGSGTSGASVTPYLDMARLGPAFS
jgi:hypothetical protein